jgi:hypothetical protein
MRYADTDSVVCKAHNDVVAHTDDDTCNGHGNRLDRRRLDLIGMYRRIYDPPESETAFEIVSADVGLFPRSIERSRYVPHGTSCTALPRSLFVNFRSTPRLCASQQMLCSW